MTQGPDMMRCICAGTHNEEATSATITRPLFGQISSLSVQLAASSATTKDLSKAIKRVGSHLPHLCPGFLSLMTTFIGLHKGSGSIQLHYEPPSST